MEMSSPGSLFIISAPTGAGKSTIAKSVLQLIDTSFAIARVITYTTRPARPKENDGADYYFVTPQDFEKKRQANFFLETTDYDDYSYGSPRSAYENLSQGQSFLIITDRVGAKTIKKLVPSAVLIWIDVPDVDTIKQRLGGRGSETQKNVQRRVAIAAQEIAEEKTEKIFDYHVMNSDLEKAIVDVATIMRNHLQHKKY